MVMLVMHILLVILSGLNASRMKDEFQKFTWTGMAICWFGICIDEISRMIDKELDSVRVYKIRGSGEVNLFGVSPAIADEEVIII